jgi:hypothetical protein
MERSAGSPANLAQAVAGDAKNNWGSLLVVF